MSGTAANGTFVGSVTTTGDTPASFTITDGNTDSDGTVDTVAEDAGVGTSVGITASANDLDGTDMVTYSLTDDAGGRFAIDSAT